MNILGRIICFLLILVLDYQACKTPAKIGQKGTPFGKGVATSLLISLAALWGWAVFWLLSHGGTIGGNTVVLEPFLLGVITLFFAASLLAFCRKHLAKDMQGCLLVLPVLLNLTLSWHFDLVTSSSQIDNWLLYSVSLGFFLVCAPFYFGIKERLTIAPIPPLLKGLPIQLTVLFLIFLSLSFFQGVFFGELF